MARMAHNSHLLFQGGVRSRVIAAEMKCPAPRSASMYPNSGCMSGPKRQAFSSLEADERPQKRHAMSRDEFPSNNDVASSSDDSHIDEESHPHASVTQRSPPIEVDKENLPEGPCLLPLEYNNETHTAKRMTVVMVHHVDWHLCDPLKNDERFQFHVFGAPKESSVDGNVVWHPKAWTMNQFFHRNGVHIVNGFYDGVVIGCDVIFENMCVDKFLKDRMSEIGYAFGFAKVIHVMTRQGLDDLKTHVPNRIQMIDRALNGFNPACLKKLTKQLEFYFGDQNYVKDHHLRKQVNMSRLGPYPGYLSFRELNKWRHIQFYTQPSYADGSFRRQRVDIVAVLIAATIKAGADIAVSHDLKGAYRLNPPNVQKQRDIKSDWKEKSVFLCGLRGPWRRFDNPKVIEAIRTHLNFYFGSIGRVQVCWKPNNRGKQRVTGYFRLDFGRKEDALKCKDYVKRGFVLWEHPIRLVSFDEYQNHPKYLVGHNWVPVNPKSGKRQSGGNAQPAGGRSGLRVGGQHDKRRGTGGKRKGAGGKRKGAGKRKTVEPNSGDMSQLYNKMPEEKPDKRELNKTFPGKMLPRYHGSELPPKGRPSARSFMV